MRRAQVAALAAGLALTAAGCVQGDAAEPRTLAVAEALEAGGEPVQVSGHLFAGDGGTVLCESVAESYPPQCGGASLRVEGLAAGDLDGLATDGDRSWSDAPVVLRGTVAGDTLRVTDGVD